MGIVDIEGSLILYVDDTSQNIDVMRKILSKEGYRVSAAPSGEAAVKIAAELNPDLILLDVMMPGMDGFETFRQLRKIKSLSDTPVIFVTAQTDSEDITRGFELGAVDYITKPVKTRVVCARVASHLKLYAVRKQQSLHKVQREIVSRLDKMIDSFYQEMLLNIESINQDQKRSLKHVDFYQDQIGRNVITRQDFSAHLLESKASSRNTMEGIRDIHELATGFRQIVHAHCQNKHQAISLNTYLSKVLAFHQKKVQKKSVKVSVNCPKDLKIKSYPWAVFYIFDELVQNALDHAFDEKFEASLEFTIQLQVDSILIQCRDNGQGLLPEQSQQMFNTELTNTSPSGLQRLSQVVSDHLSGTINGRTSLGQGLQVDITLPLSLKTN